MLGNILTDLFPFYFPFLYMHKSNECKTETKLIKQKCQTKLEVIRKFFENYTPWYSGICSKNAKLVEHPH